MVRESCLASVRSKWTRDRIIDIDCRDFERRLNRGPHLGFHPDVLSMLVTDRNGLTFKRQLSDF